jgi:hypothetical protein
MKKCNLKTLMMIIGSRKKEQAREVRKDVLPNATSAKILTEWQGKCMGGFCLQDRNQSTH